MKLNDYDLLKFIVRDYSPRVPKYLARPMPPPKLHLLTSIIRWSKPPVSTLLFMKCTLQYPFPRATIAFLCLKQRGDPSFVQKLYPAAESSSAGMY
jgi:hypothetical protein